MAVWVLIPDKFEFSREPDSQLGVLALGLTMGQWLSVPMMLVGGALLASASRRAERSTARRLAGSPAARENEE